MTGLGGFEPRLRWVRSALPLLLSQRLPCRGKRGVASPNRSCDMIVPRYPCKLLRPGSHTRERSFGVPLSEAVVKLSIHQTGVNIVKSASKMSPLASAGGIANQNLELSVSRFRERVRMRHIHRLSRQNAN